MLSASEYDSSYDYDYAHDDYEGDEAEDCGYGFNGGCACRGGVRGCCASGSACGCFNHVACYRLRVGCGC